MAYIELEEALERVKHGVYTSKDGHHDDCAGAWMDGVGDAIEQICEMLSEIPPADVEPIVYAEWIETDYKPYAYRKCSACGRRVGIYDTTERCPKCGAHMKKDGGGNG